MIALVDCNSFFCSVEKAFHPGLHGRPVCVLSCNDGCVVALTPEAKKIGIKRGDPIFKQKDVVERYGVTLFSTNMTLYATMSKRINHILRSAVHHMESYSIDESFCYLDGMETHYDLTDYMRSVAQRIKLYTDVPVGVGIAPTKTLAKMGSKFAKNYCGYHGVCAIDTDEKRLKALELFDLADVWGIGRHTFEKLTYYGIRSPLDLADKRENWVCSHFNRPTVQTWRELNGESCIDTTEVYQRQTICTSRSFGDMITDRNILRGSVAHFASSCANKLRGQHSVTDTVTVFVTSNRFREDLPQYSNVQTTMLPVSTSDTLEITNAALRVLDNMFVEGISYNKAGVILGHITDAGAVQQYLFDSIDNRMERNTLMSTIDSINQRYGVKTLHLAIEGEGHQKWHAKSEHCSGNYLTDISQILTVKV